MKKKIITLVLAFCMVVSMSACTQDGDPATTTPAGGTQSGDVSGDASGSGSTDPTPTEYEPTGAQLIAGKQYGTAWETLYDKYGSDITINDVKEDPNTGLAYIEKDGQTYELGLDFLSMAMVYNTVVDGKSEDDVYAEWWKYYISRWNEMVPEIPLYSNEYYDVVNAKITGVKEHPTNPYWGPAKALLDWASEKDDNSIILGSTTDLSGKFRYSNFGSTNPGSADLDIENLTSGFLETVTATKDGSYVTNEQVVKDLQETDNEDGTKTFTIEIHDDLKFSDGSAITAKNYLYQVLAFSTPVATQAAGRDAQSGLTIDGYDHFSVYDGTNDGQEVIPVDDEGNEVPEQATTASKVFSGLRLLDDYKFSVTVNADYLPYYYANTYASFSPVYKDVWFGGSDIADDGEGVYITGDFYAKSGEDYTMAAHIKASSTNTDTTYPYAGPYVVESYDEAAKQAVLSLNPNFKGNYEGVKPTIEKVIYSKVVSETQLEQLSSGEVDVLSGITGGAATDEAIAMADGSDGAFVYTHYARAGYGKLGMRCDLGPAQFTEVRQAVAYCLDRAQFAKDFTGGYGGVVDGPYYTGSWQYKAVSSSMQLNAYETSTDTAISVLEAGGWIYNDKGEAYTEGVRYKKIPAEYASDRDKSFKSIDGAYQTVEINGDYYMPLVFNWFGTTDNEFSDLLVTAFLNGENFKNAGFAVQNTLGTFEAMFDEYYEANVYGQTYSGVPTYNATNSATGFTSAIYDYSFNMSPVPVYYANLYNMYFIIDDADIILK